MDYCSKDVRLPVQLQRAMAAEAEAAREARAKVHLIYKQEFYSDRSDLPLMSAALQYSLSLR